MRALLFLFNERFSLRSSNISPWQTDTAVCTESKPSCFLSSTYVWLSVCLRLPHWQQEFIRISAHQCLINSQNIPHRYTMFKPNYWSDKDQNVQPPLTPCTYTLGSIRPLTVGAQEKKEKAGNDPDALRVFSEHPDSSFLLTFWTWSQFRL